MADSKITITEIYASIQGESSYAGWPCVFVRLTGCPLRCKWCDTAYAFAGGSDLQINEIIEKVKDLGLPLVELTGGEPLAQPGGYALAQALVEQNYKVLIETSGAMSLAGLSPKVHVIMDLKCPDSGMSDKNLMTNLALLKPTDEIKFVLASRRDYEWALGMVREHQLDGRCQLLFSCAFGLLAPKDLAAWMVADRVPARLQLQQHKYIWSPRAKGV